MSIVSRYLLREFLLSSATVFAAIYSTWVAADTLLHLDELSGSWREVLQRVLFDSLEAFPLGAPMACVVGVVWSISRAVRFREITAIRCGGMPLQSALVPVLLASLLLAAGLVAFEDRVLVSARLSLLGEEFGSSKEIAFVNGRWWYARGSSVFSATRFSGEERALEDVTVFELDDTHSIRRRIDAERAVHIDGSIWRFQHPQIREFDGTEGPSDRIVEELQIDLGLSHGDMARATPPISATTLHRLSRRIRQLREIGRGVTPLETGFHRRLAQPLATLVLVLLAIPLAIGDVEHGDSLPRSLLFSMGASGLFWLSFTGALLASQSNLVPPALPIWSVICVFLGIGAWRFRAISE